jgi:hypothetical protein
MSATTLIVLLILLVPTLVYGLSWYRQRAGEQRHVADVAAAQRGYLVSNWAEVEAAAAKSGMDPEQIAAVRRKLVGG